MGGELLVRKCVHCHGRGLAGPDLGGVDLAEAGHDLELGEVDEREQRRRSCSSRGGAGGAGRRCSAAADGLANGGTDRGDRPVGGCLQRRLLERELGSRERCLGGRDVRLGGCEVALGGGLALDRVRCDGRLLVESRCREGLLRRSPWTGRCVRLVEARLCCALATCFESDATLVLSFVTAVSSES